MKQLLSDALAIDDALVSVDGITQESRFLFPFWNKRQKAVHLFEIKGHLKPWTKAVVLFEMNWQFFLLLNDQ